MRAINGWKELVDLEIKFDSSGKEWVFRGQSSPSHRLKTTLERACEDFGIDGERVRIIENALIADFRRSCHLYLTPVLPDEGDTISWLALMRHYGAPSRLLDFTYSLFIAAYFAAEMEKAKPVVWAVSKTWLKQHMHGAMSDLSKSERFVEAWAKREGWVFDQLFIKRDPPLHLVAPINPLRMNDRLAVQQGLFLCCSDVTMPFHDALERIPESADNVIPVQINSEDARREILARLYRTGVNRAALFPGLQGYAESLRSKMLLFLQLQRLREAGARMGPEVIGV
ncbi:MAG: FRG domain-containing protein [Candidatus Zixiibacteriota bacterium]